MLFLRNLERKSQLIPLKTLLHLCINHTQLFIMLDVKLPTLLITKGKTNSRRKTNRLISDWQL